MATAEARGSAYAGAAAQGRAGAQLDLKEGTFDANIEGSAFAGAKAEGTAHAKVAGVGEASATGSVGVGVGASIKASAGCVKGKCKLQFGIGLFCGIGAEGNVSVTIDFKAMQRKIVKKFKAAKRKLFSFIRSFLGPPRRKRRLKRTEVSKDKRSSFSLVRWWKEGRKKKKKND